MLNISRKFKNAILLNRNPQYRLALEAGIHPVTLSRILTGYQILKKKPDPRLLKIAKIIGYPEDHIFCDFEPEGVFDEK